MKNKQIIIFILSLIILYLFFGKGITMKFIKYMKGETWNKLIPEMKTAVTTTIEDAQSQGLDVMFFEGYRTVERSQEMIDKGVSDLKDARNSDHVWGIGADIVVANNLGFPSWPDVTDPRWKKLHDIGAKHGLEFYISWDKPHARLKGYTVSSLKNDYDNPDDFLKKAGINV